MKTKLFFTLLCFSVTFLLNAQIKVKSNGKAILGTELPFTQDNDSVLSMQILGKGEYGTKSMVAFGDYGRASTGSCNVVIGEYGTDDTDRLWLHGKIGTYLTYINQSNVIASYDMNNGNMFNFNCEVWSNGIKLTSDERLKTNINKINNSMTNLRKLNGVSYNLLRKESLNVKNNLTLSPIVSATVRLTEKEQKDKAFIDAYENKIKNFKPKRMGFLAQDLQKVFPELVDKDSTGYFSVDYIGLIPVIIEALKEQDSIISVLNSEIKALKQLVKNDNPLKSPNLISDVDLTEFDVATLDQNIPNPSSTTTVIGFYLPATIVSANIYVYDMNGVQLKNYSISERGKKNVTINGSEFNAGMYLYALIADGKVIDTKRMILTK